MPITLLVVAVVLQEVLIANHPDAGGRLGVVAAAVAERVAVAVAVALETQVQMQTLPHTVVFL